MSRLLIVAAALLAGTAIASAQDNPAGSRAQDRGNTEEAIGATHQDDALRSRAQGRLPRGLMQAPERGPAGQAEPPGGAYQDERQNEENGLTPQGGR